MRYIINPFVAQRREMKLRLLDLIKNQPEMEMTQLVALFSLQTGLKKARVLEYWQELVEAGLLRENGRDSAKRGPERASEEHERSDDGRFRASANSEKPGSAEQAPAPETAREQDTGGEQEDGADIDGRVGDREREVE